MAAKPDKQTDPRRRGIDFHKPLCKCRACKGKTQALTESAGAGGPELDADGKVAAERAKIALVKPDTISAENPIHIMQQDHTTKTKTAVLKYIALRGEGFNREEIAEQLNLKPATLNTYIKRAVQQGWLKLDDPLERFKEQIVPKVVDNIEHFINAKDKQMTIEAAKGAGIFRSYQAVRIESETPQTMLAIKIEALPPQEGSPKVITGIVGRSRILEGSIEPE